MALSMARIDEHHYLYGSVINSDTVLWLARYVDIRAESNRSVAADSMPCFRMWMQGIAGTVGI